MLSRLKKKIEKWLRLWSVLKDLKKNYEFILYFKTVCSYTGSGNDQERLVICYLILNCIFFVKNVFVA